MKNVACLLLEWAVTNYPQHGDYVVVCNANDPGKHDWQRSLRFTAKHLGVREVTLQELYSDPELVFLSLEFDQIVSPQRFTSRQLYNLHFSLLPKYRGVAPAVWPLLFGDSESGVTLHRMEQGIDTGGIVAQSTFEISDDDNARDIYNKCTDEGIALVKREFLKFTQGQVESSPQPIKGASYFGKKSVDFKTPPIDFRRTAWQVHNSLRAFSFHEYQYPVHPVAGPIAQSRLSHVVSIKKPGEFTSVTRWSGSLATFDYDLDVFLSPYAELYAWCRGEGDQPEQFDEMLKVVDLNRVDANGWTPLAVASFHGNLEACRTILNSGADPNATGLRGTHALMYAKEYFKLSTDDSVFCLLLDHGADVEQTDVHGVSTRQYVEQDGTLNRLLTRMVTN